MRKKPLKIAVHKFTSCDGCQLSFVHIGLGLISLSKYIEFVHFAELGPVNEDADVDVAFIEGSISTSTCLERIQKIRQQAKTLIAIGACATSGGIQALRNIDNVDDWKKSIYANADIIDALKTSTPISDHVKVDFELWGCPINKDQLLSIIQSLIHGVKPHIPHESVCIECKKQNNVCVMVTEKAPCLGPVTQAGCNALCPSLNRACYGCYGPKENANTNSLVEQFKRIGLSHDEINRRFAFINNNARVFKKVKL